VRGCARPLGLRTTSEQNSGQTNSSLSQAYKKCNNYTVEFEFDPEKSVRNKAKHGIDFQEAQALWKDPDLLEILNE